MEKECKKCKTTHTKPEILLWRCTECETVVCSNCTDRDLRCPESCGHTLEIVPIYNA